MKKFDSHLRNILLARDMCAGMSQREIAVKYGLSYGYAGMRMRVARSYLRSRRPWSLKQAFGVEDIGWIIPQPYTFP